MSIDSVSHIHFIGIGGIGMSALARFFVHEGKTVTGSDRASSIVTEGLEALGIIIDYTQSGAIIYDSKKEGVVPIGMVVYTEAMAHDHPEMLAARALGVPMMNYFEALGQVANEYYLIAVAGSHGKSTTTSMTADVLEEAGFDPTVVVGTLRSKTKSNFRAGKSKYAVVEACEYKRDFLSLRPDVLVITNIDYEHVDYYKDLADVQSAFRELAQMIPEDGAIVANVTDANIAPVLKGVSAQIIDYRPLIDLTIKLRHPGLHNRMNAAGARGVGEFLGIETATINDALENFAGTWRRFEYKGDVLGAPVYDDYGHHPTEIKATFAGVRELYPDRRFIAVFQSHTYTRTHELFDDFAAALAGADVVFQLPIYAAREENVSGVTSEALAEAIAVRGKVAVVFQTIPAAALAVRELLEDGVPSVVVTIGAGEVTKVADELIQ